MDVVVNGEKHRLEAGATVERLLAALGLSSTRVAVEVNREVVSRSAWPSTQLRDHDRIEIVQFVGGG